MEEPKLSHYERYKDTITGYHKKNPEKVKEIKKRYNVKLTLKRQEKMYEKLKEKFDKK
jgi:transketolase